MTMVVIVIFEIFDPAFVGGRGDNQFFRHENSLGRMAASFCPRWVRNSGAGPGRTGTHACDTCREAARCSNAEGRFPAGPEWPTTKCVLWRSRLLLLRVTRCREGPGQTADDAVLTLSILNIRPGAAFLSCSQALGTGGSPN